MALSANDAFAAGGRRGRRRGRRGRGALSEINVTPLVDVMMVLLIIFMISAPLLTVGVPLELPKTEAGALSDQNQPITVSIRRDGAIFLGEEELPYGALSDRTTALANGDIATGFLSCRGRRLVPGRDAEFHPGSARLGKADGDGLFPGAYVAAAAFECGGLIPADALAAANQLVVADLRGVESHGMARLPGYIMHLRNGTTDAKAQLTVERESPSAVSFNANNGVGLLQGPRAMARCIEKARDTGLCMATVRNSNHFGIAGTYVRQATDAGLGGMAMTNAGAIAVPVLEMVYSAHAGAGGNRVRNFW